MPPVFGPLSPSRARLKSWAGCSGTTVVPSVIAKSETSGPSRNSSITTRPQAFACALACSRSPVTTTPLPAARPSSLTTYGAPKASSASSTSAGVVQTYERAVGTPAAAITSLAKALEPSSRAASFEGPKTGMPASRTASATPATSGASGPTTTSSAPSSAARALTARPSRASTWCSSATSAMPALPGAQWRAVTSGSRDRERHRACSRAPLPMTRTFTPPSLTGGVRAPCTGFRGREGQDFGRSSKRGRRPPLSSPVPPLLRPVPVPLPVPLSVPLRTSPRAPTRC